VNIDMPTLNHLATFMTLTRNQLAIHQYASIPRQYSTDKGTTIAQGIANPTATKLGLYINLLRQRLVQYAIKKV